MSTTVATAASSIVGKYSSGADAYAGTINTVNAMQGGIISNKPPYISSDAQDLGSGLANQHLPCHGQRWRAFFDLKFRMRCIT